MGGNVGQASAQFEAYFLRRLLKEVRGSSGGGMLDGGTGGRMFREMLDEALADAMAEAGGLGLSDSMTTEFGDDEASGDAAPQSAPVGPRRAAAAYSRVSSGYGMRVHPVHGTKKFHAGIDLPAAEGTPVPVVQAGTVSRAEQAGGYGNLVVVDHGDGVTTRYAHLSKIDVSVGERVEPGQSLGGVGQTGTATGPHLHFELRIRGRAVNPKKLMPALKNLGPGTNPR